MQLKQGQKYIVRDVLWGDVETELDNDHSLQVRMNPFSARILEINELPLK